MKEYTLIAFISVFLTLFLDRISGAALLKRKDYYSFLIVILCFKLLVNGYLTSGIVLYNPRFFLGLRIGSIPIEDFLFGFSMVTQTIIFWEYFKKGK
jgi:lycopene cyclase domain-containing protein